MIYEQTLNAFKHGGEPLAAADAHGLESIPAAAAL
jgi:hypothetical protein